MDTAQREQLLDSRYKRGFTLIEIMVSVSLLAFVAAFLTVPLITFYQSTVITVETERIVTAIEEARKNTLSSYDLDQYGVHFETQRIVVYKGATFVEPNTENEEIILNQLITIATTTLTGGGSDTLFDRLTGETSQDGIIVIHSVNGSVSDRTLTIHPTGLIELE